MTVNGIDKMVGSYAKIAGIEVAGLGCRTYEPRRPSMPDHVADITKVQFWFKYANIRTMRIQGRRQNRLEYSLT
jgi:integrase/recombinase XerD